MIFLIEADAGHYLCLPALVSSAALSGAASSGTSALTSDGVRLVDSLNDLVECANGMDDSAESLRISAARREADVTGEVGSSMPVNPSDPAAKPAMGVPSDIF